MPKREERDLYSHAFDGNPFEEFDAEEMFESLQWGNPVSNIYDIEAPEALATLGDLAKLDSDFGVFDFDENDAPYLAVGNDSNYLFIIPKGLIRKNPNPVIPIFNPSSPEWDEKGLVNETHYYSDKGNDEAYYFHEHQTPLPSLWQHKSGIAVLIPADNKGIPSYAVAKEGIIG
jgi:hypothetical protein